MKNPITAFTVGLMIVAVVVALGIITAALGGCDNRKTIHCKDGTHSIGTHTNPHLCNNHGGINYTS